MKKRTIHFAVAAAFAAASLATGVAHAVVEMEGPTNHGNDSFGTPQHLDIVNGSVEVNGSIGVLTKSLPVEADVDFYSFEAFEGNVVNIDINGGIKDFTSASRSVDTNIAVFAPDGTILRENDDVIDPATGAVTDQDANITGWVVPATGTYIVGVSSFGRNFLQGGALTMTFVNPNLGNGSYTLTIDGIAAPPAPPAPPPSYVQYINIDIKPRHAGVARIYAHADGKIAVAMLSSSSYDAATLNRASLTFGPTGDEASLVRCHDELIDVNRDGYKDLVCRFDLKTANFEPGDLEGVLKGSTADGQSIEGRAPLKVVQKTKKKRKHGDRDHDRDDDRRGHGNRGHGGRD